MLQRVVFLSVLLFSTSANAISTTFVDNYTGGNPTNSGWNGQDVIGDLDKFSITDMTVDVSGGQLTVGIHTSYLDNVGRSGTDLGALFISTNGWHPFGPAPYLNDDNTNGEDWEYALIIQRQPTQGEVNLLGQSGLAFLYQIPSKNSIIMSHSLPGHIFRGDQEVGLDTTGLQPALVGSWSMTDVIGSDHDLLTFNIGLDGLGPITGGNLGLRWEMTCGNDVIEGSAPVPEPISAGLLGMGLVGIASRKKRK